MTSNELLSETEIYTMYDKLTDGLYTNIVGVIFSLIVLVVLIVYLFKQKNNLY